MADIDALLAALTLEEKAALTAGEDVSARPPLTVVGPAGATQERRAPGWQPDAGRYELLIGRSSADIAVRRTVEVVPE